jgi:hypothetical protein
MTEQGGQPHSQLRPRPCCGAVRPDRRDPGRRRLTLGVLATSTLGTPVHGLNVCRLVAAGFVAPTLRGLPGALESPVVGSAASWPLGTGFVVVEFAVGVVGVRSGVAMRSWIIAASSTPM